MQRVGLEKVENKGKGFELYVYLYTMVFLLFNQFIIFLVFLWLGSVNPFRLIGVGLTVWTFGTAGCGLSINFWSITICRMWVHYAGFFKCYLFFLLFLLVGSWFYLLIIYLLYQDGGCWWGIFYKPCCSIHWWQCPSWSGLFCICDSVMQSMMHAVMLVFYFCSEAKKILGSSGLWMLISIANVMGSSVPLPVLLVH